MAEPLLDVNGVTLQYKTKDHLVTATYRVGFQVFRSDRYVILGPSGCGKSTLLKSVGGYIQPVEGEMRLTGSPPAAGCRAGRRKKRRRTTSRRSTWGSSPTATRTRCRAG